MGGTHIHFDARSVRLVVGGVVVTFDSTKVPERAEVIETATTVTITLLEGEKHRKHRRFSHHEVFVPLDGPLTCRHIIDGSHMMTTRRAA